MVAMISKNNVYQLKSNISNLLNFIITTFRSHGRLNTKTNQDEIMDVCWEGIPTIELIDMFALGTSCPAMVGKPKIFIIQVF